MIEKFKHKGLKKFWTSDDASKIPSEMVEKIRLILDFLNDVEEVPQDFEAFKSLRLHPLKGELKDFWSLDVTENYRIIFKFDGKNVYDIDLRDTH